MPNQIEATQDDLVKITLRSEDVPVTAGLVIDNSSSMLSRRKMVVAGGMTFATTSHPEDELFIVSFTERVRLALPVGAAVIGPALGNGSAQAVKVGSKEASPSRRAGSRGWLQR